MLSHRNPTMEAQEKDRKLGAQLDDHYDYEDDFIDDSEFVEYYEGGDRRKAKYSGFFINKGTVEKVGRFCRWQCNMLCLAVLCAVTMEH